MKPRSICGIWIFLEIMVLSQLWSRITCQDTYHQGYSIQVSSSVRIQEGLSVSIPCTFTADNRKTFTNSYGYWMRSPLLSGYISATNDKSESMKKPNFHLTGNPDKGDCTLIIADARKEDEGEYFFRFVEKKDSSVKYNYFREVTITITVTVPCVDPTEEPVILDPGTMIAGEKKTVTCAPPGNCPAASLSFQWKKSNMAGIWENSPTVTFAPSLDDHQKTITCEMRNTKGKITQKSILLDVLYPPTNIEITIHSSEGGELTAGPQVAIGQTETLTLVCKANGNPPATVVWVKWSGEADMGATDLSNSGLTATIKVTSSMADVYRCLAWNTLGVREQRIQVVVKKGITHHPGYSIQVASSAHVQEGLCVSIPCSFTADYRNTFTNSSGYWIKKDTEPYYIVASNDKSSVIQKPNFHLTGNPDTGDCTLTIDDARNEDEGEYYFRFVESKDSKVKYNYNREVTISITVTDLTNEPVVSDPGTVIAGKNKTVTCAPSGNCLATSLVLQWRKSDVTGIWKNSPNVTFIPSINDHQKTITCEMKTIRGKITRKSILLDVPYPPRSIEINIHSSAGGELPGGSQVVINENEILTLVCRADGNPPATVVWVKWSGESDMDARNISNSGLLAMKNVTSSMAGVYQCLVWNALGLREQRFEVVIKQGSADEEKTCGGIPYWYLAIAFIGGACIIALLTLPYICITRKNINKKNTFIGTKQSVGCVKASEDQIYMNVM